MSHWVRVSRAWLEGVLDSAVLHTRGLPLARDYRGLTDRQFFMEISHHEIRRTMDDIVARDFRDQEVALWLSSDGVTRHMRFAYASDALMFKLVMPT